jgi:D-xylose transport system permease protein
VLLIVDFVVRRTTYGRQIFAVGGNAEAARRAGINVERVRLTVFAIASALAALGGLFQAAEAGGASKSLGSGNLLMNVIAAAVIGGTSLFGGRGWVWSALLGTLVIQSITTGLNLMNMSSEIQYMITGAVLLIAVVVDSISRRTQRPRGEPDHPYNRHVRSKTGPGCERASRAGRACDVSGGPGPQGFRAEH